MKTASLSLLGFILTFLSFSISAKNENGVEPMQLVILGTGTPHADPVRSGPALAIIKNDKSYIIDTGAGIVRRASAASKKHNISSLKAKNISTAFLTHLHSDHTVGLPDLIFSPWVLGRKQMLQLYGPVGTEKMATNILKAYEQDINMRLGGLEPANPDGYRVNTHEIVKAGIIFDTDDIKVTAIPVLHGSWKQAFGFMFTDGTKKIVVSGDARPSPALLEAAKGADILVHEVYSVQGFKKREPNWQTYHASFHTSTHELAKIANEAKPKLLVLYHQLYWGFTDEDLIKEIREAGYNGNVISASDLDIFQ